MGSYRRKTRFTKPDELVTAETLSACGISPSDAVLVGLSGGADSVALLYALCAARARGEISGISAAHLHHGIRGAEADADLAFCQALCTSLAVPFFYERADVPLLAKARGESVETYGRIARYAFLERARQEAHADCIAVAHHRNDQAETVLLHLIRGAGLDGLTGMKRKNGRIVRPLLSVPKAEILSCLYAQGIGYCSDATNDMPVAERNRVRLRVMPALERINPRAAEHIALSADMLSEDAAYLSECGSALLSAARAEDGTLLLSVLQKAPAPIRRRALMRFLGNDVARSDVLRVEALLFSGSAKRIELPGGRIARVGGERLFIGREREVRAFETPFVRVGETMFPGGRFVSERRNAFSRPESAAEAYIDADAVPLDAVVRTRRSGDRFFPLGAPGERLLSDCMIDRKLPRGKRDVPLLISGNETLWMPGYTVSERVKVAGKTREILHIQYVEEDGDS